MSVCISRFGEFGTHTLNANHECVRCGTFDMAALGPGARTYYRTLLIKYIDHVGREEGTVFLDSLAGGRRRPGRFTDGEWAELNHLASIDVATLDPSSGTVL
jgi:hypothetical protein